jgi:hypothetical protein
LARPYGFGRIGDVPPGFDLDKNQQAAAPGNDIDFADGGAETTGDNPKALYPERPCRQRFGETAEFFRRLFFVY